MTLPTVEYGPATVASDAREPLADLSQTLPIAGRRWLIETVRQPFEREVQGYRAVPVHPATLTREHIAPCSSRRVLDPWMGTGQVHAILTPAGKRLFAELTRRVVGHRVAIAFEDAVMSIPVVQEPIEGGTIAVTVGHGADEGEAWALAAVLGSAALPPGVSCTAR